MLFGSYIHASAQTQQGIEFTDLASRATAALEESKISNAAVFDFVSHDLRVTLLTRTWASTFSTALVKSAPQLNLIGPSMFTPEIESNHFSPAIVSDPEIASWLAKKAGAHAFIQGIVSIESEENKVVLVLQATRVEDGKGIGAWRVTSPLTEEIKSQMAEDLDPDAQVVNSNPAKGQTLPACIHCPNPSYTDAAIKNHTQGTVLISAVIGKDQKARDFLVTKHLRDGLTLRAVQALQNWTFRSARTSDDGSPIDVKMVVEVNFRLYK